MTTSTLAVPMTDEQYVAKKGNLCPFCGADAVDGESIQVDGGEAFQECSCRECNSQWEDVYKLVGYIQPR